MFETMESRTMFAAQYLPTLPDALSYGGARAPVVAEAAVKESTGSLNGRATISLMPVMFDRLTQAAQRRLVKICGLVHTGGGLVRRRWIAQKTLCNGGCGGTIPVGKQRRWRGA